ncbi:MAG: RNA degradosome polyphosphate kinase [Clostridia bacterium]
MYNIPFNNRELSWLDFNERVLDETLKKDNPLMERLKFLAITSSNLDEFFMVRVAGVKAQVNSKINKKDDSGHTPTELLEKLNVKTHIFMDKQYSYLNRSLVPALKKNDISFITYDSLEKTAKKQIDDYFTKVIFPVITPLAVDNSRPFPTLANKTLNIAVELEEKEEKTPCFAIVQVPSILPRYIKIENEKGQMTFILLENIICAKLSVFFELHDITAYSMFRITRSADMTIDEEAEDFLWEMEKSVKKRRRGNPIRLELTAKTETSIKKFLSKNLEIKSKEIYECAGPLDLTFLMKFAFTAGFENFYFDPIKPVNPAPDFFGSEDVFETIKLKDRMVHHPYESFDCVVKFIQTAAEDENVLAIKQTLYRVSGNSPIIAALIKAAENGKQVTVLVELKARFDEENNIIWAKKLEKAGCHVIYGLFALKTHCKIALVVRKEDDGIRRYVHMGTGNYNDSTAKIYTDLSMFTCNERYGADASSLFNVLTGYSRPPEYNHFVVAPHSMRNFFVRMIKNEVENAKNGLPCGIKVKVNSLIDPQITTELYKASQAGVKIELIVRGVCGLIPGIEGLSENITVTSIVGQLLEHSRIFIFENACSTKIYLGSADWMPRNLDRRVELVFPVSDTDLKERVLNIFDTMLSDTTNARIMQNDTTYNNIDKRGKLKLNSQQYFSKQSSQKLKDLKADIIDSPLIPIHSAE